MAVLLSNRKATYNYEIIEKFTAGIKLEGFEVKALKTKHGGSLQGSYILLRNDTLTLRGLHLPPYQTNNTPDWYTPNRDRKLLVTKKEYANLDRILNERGLTIIPLVIHNDRHRIVVECAVVRGKKKHDKRQSIRKREDERNVARTLKLK